MPIKNRIRKEEGATAIMVAVMLFMFMGFAALAVDSGLGFNERRLDQTVADNSVMGFVVSTSIDGQAAGAVDARNLAATNLGIDPADVAWLASWEACVDPEAFAVQPLPNVECMSIDFQDEELTFRVRLPDQSVDTTFGAVLGITEISTGAFAEATIETEPEGKVIPFGLFAGANGESCIGDTAGPALPPPCDGPAIGQFGPFVSHFYVDPFQCINNGFIVNVALGLDHNLGSFSNSYAPGDTEIFEGCTAGVPDGTPNTVEPSPGNQVGNIAQGLFGSGNIFGRAFTGRLVDGGGSASIEATGIGPVNINNEPIWQFFIPGSSCHTAVAAAADDIARKAASEGCLIAWNGVEPLFVGNFLDARRVAFVPRYFETVAGPGVDYHIQENIPVYLESVYIQDGGTWVIHHPPLTGPFSGANQVRALTAFVLDCGMFSGVCNANAAPGQLGVDSLLTLRLSR